MARLRRGLPAPTPVSRSGLGSSFALALLAIAPGTVLAQETAPAPGSAWSILEADLLILFRILVVATVIERVLEYLSLVWGPAETAWRRVFRRRAALQAEAPHELPPELAKIRKQVILQSLGVLLGVAICWRSHLGIFGQLEDAASGKLGQAVTHWFTARAGSWLDYVITGLLAGLGTEPIHSLIMTLLRRKDLRRARSAPAT